MSLFILLIHASHLFWTRNCIVKHFRNDLQLCLDFGMLGYRTLEFLMLESNFYAERWDDSWLKSRKWCFERNTRKDSSKVILIHWSTNINTALIAHLANCLEIGIQKITLKQPGLINCWISILCAYLVWNG